VEGREGGREGRKERGWACRLCFTKSHLFVLHARSENSPTTLDERERKECYNYSTPLTNLPFSPPPIYIKNKQKHKAFPRGRRAIILRVCSFTDYGLGIRALRAPRSRGVTSAGKI